MPSLLSKLGYLERAQVAELLEAWECPLRVMRRIQWREEEAEEEAEEEEMMVAAVATAPLAILQGHYRVAFSTQVAADSANDVGSRT